MQSFPPADATISNSVSQKTADDEDGEHQEGSPAPRGCEGRTAALSNAECDVTSNGHAPPCCPVAPIDASPGATSSTRTNSQTTSETSLVPSLIHACPPPDPADNIVSQNVRAVDAVDSNQADNDPPRGCNHEENEGGAVCCTTKAPNNDGRLNSHETLFCSASSNGTSLGATASPLTQSSSQASASLFQEPSDCPPPKSDASHASLVAMLRCGTECPPNKVSVMDVCRAICRHRPGACGDAEGVTADALRALPVAALEAMAELFSLARGGDVPAAWHRSTVVPLRKAGGGDGCDAWRPLAIGSLVARTWEYTVASPGLSQGRVACLNDANKFSTYPMGTCIHCLRVPREC